MDNLCSQKKKKKKSKRGNNGGSKGKQLAGSTASVQTTIASSSTRSSAGEDDATLLARLEERLRKTVLSDQPKEKEVSVSVDGYVLVKSVKPEEGADKKKSDFKQGRKVKCSTPNCQKEDSWRNMKNDKILANDDDGEWYWLYTCVECHMKKKNMTRGEAVTDIKKTRGDNVKRKARIEEFTQAKKQVLQTHPMMTDKQEVRMLTRMTLVTEVFAPLAKLIELKCRHMNQNKELWEQYEKLLELVGVCKTADESKVLMQKLTDHEKKMEETELPQAFQTVCKPGSEEHWRYMQAAQYSDEWVCNKQNGKVLSAFRSFYICLSGGAEPCGAVIPSKTWRTFHEDPLAPKQRWYCVCCGAKYLTKFGMIIELEIRGEIFYVKAEIPPHSLEDLRAMWLEETLKPSRPEELYDMLKLVTPQKSKILRPMCPSDVLDAYQTRYDPNAYKITSSAYKTLPNFNWQQIMNFGPG